MRFIFPQRGQQTLQCHGIVGIIDQQGELIGYLDHLDTAFYLCLQQRLFNVFLIYLEMTADGNSRQRIVHAEFAGHGHFHIKIHQSGYVESHAQFSGLMHQFPFFRPEHTVLSHSEVLQCAGMSFRHCLPVLIVTIHNTYLALFEQ